MIVPSSCREIGEVAGPFEKRRCVNQSRRKSTYFAGTLVVTKKEQLIFHDRGADGASELITFEYAPFLIEVVFGVEFLIAKEFVSRAVNLVGAALGDDIHNGA